MSSVRIYGGSRFALVYEWLIDAASPNAQRLFTVLWVRYAIHQNKTKGSADPSRKRMAADMGVSVSTIDRLLAELRSIGAIDVQPRSDDHGDPTTNLYTLYPQGMGTITSEETPPLTSEEGGASTGDDLSQDREDQEYSDTRGEGWWSIMTTLKGYKEGNHTDAQRAILDTCERANVDPSAVIAQFSWDWPLLQAKHKRQDPVRFLCNPTPLRIAIEKVKRQPAGRMSIVTDPEHFSQPLPNGRDW